MQQEQAMPEDRIQMMPEDDELWAKKGPRDAISAEAAPGVMVSLTATEKPAGVFLDIEPKSAVDIASTYFDLWTPTGDVSSPRVNMRSKAAAAIMSNVLQNWSVEKLSLPGIAPEALSGTDTFEGLYAIRGFDSILREVLEKIVEAGYAVLNNDECVKVYRVAEIVDEMRIDPYMVRMAGG